MKLMSDSDGNLPLAMLRGIPIGILLFLYTWIGDGSRSAPPVVIYTQLFAGTLLVGWWIWKIIRQEKLPSTPLNLPLVAYLGVFVLATWFSADMRLSFDSLLSQTVLVLIFFLICDLLLAGWSPTAFIIALLTLTTLLLGEAILTIAQWYHQWYAIRVLEYPTFLIPYRLYGVSDHPNRLAGILNLALPFVILGLARARRTLSKLGWASWLLVYVVVIFFTRSRGGWVSASVVIGVTVSWVAYRRAGLPKGNIPGWIRRTAGIWLTLAAYVSVFAGLHLVDVQQSPSKFSTNSGGIAAGRLTFWRVAIEDLLNHPVIGSGPLTYARFYLDSGVGSRTWIAPHAHNIFFNTLAEQGLLGVVVLMIVVLTFAWAIMNAWWNALSGNITLTDKGYYVLMGVTAALAGLTMHHQVDIVINYPTNALVVVILIASVLYKIDALQPTSGALPRWAAVAVLVPVLLLVPLQRFNAAHAALRQGVVYALQGDWDAAAEKTSEAKSIDPTFYHYYGQAGFASGMRLHTKSGRNNPSAVQTALEDYRIALQQQPDYVPNLLNTVAVLRQTETFPSQVERLLVRAIEHDEGWSLPKLMLAYYYSSQGHSVKATALYNEVLSNRPDVYMWAACQRDERCREAGTVDLASEGSLLSVHLEAQRFLAEGNPNAALATLRTAPFTDKSPQPWLDRAEAHIALDQVPQAEYSLHVATRLQADSSTATAVQARLVEARLFLKKNETQKAIDALEAVLYPQITHAAIVYNWYVFRRIGLPGPLLPSVRMLKRTCRDLEAFEMLAELYVEQGYRVDARHVQNESRQLTKLLYDDEDLAQHLCYPNQ